MFVAISRDPSLEYTRLNQGSLTLHLLPDRLDEADVVVECGEHFGLGVVGSPEGIDCKLPARNCVREGVPELRRAKKVPKN